MGTALSSANGEYLCSLLSCARVELADGYRLSHRKANATQNCSGSESPREFAFKGEATVSGEYVKEAACFRKTVISPRNGLRARSELCKVSPFQRGKVQLEEVDLESCEGNYEPSYRGAISFV